MTTRSIIFLLGFIICLNIDYSFSEDIVLNSGDKYKNINVFKQEADRLLITYPGGMATICLKDCPKDIQRKYNYNATDADIAISERKKKAHAAWEHLNGDLKTEAKNQEIKAANEKVQNDIKAKAQIIENQRLIKAQSVDVTPAMDSTVQEQTRRNEVRREADESGSQTRNTRTFIVPAAETRSVNVTKSQAEQDSQTAQNAKRTADSVQNARSVGSDYSSRKNAQFIQQAEQGNGRDAGQRFLDQFNKENPAPLKVRLVP